MKIQDFVTLKSFLPGWLVDFLWQAYIRIKGGQMILPTLPDVKDMSIDEINAEIAIFLGYRAFHFLKDEKGMVRVLNDDSIEFYESGGIKMTQIDHIPPGAEIYIIPNRFWASSMNSINEAEEALSEDQRWRYVDELAGDWTRKDLAWGLIHADPETRARAFVRTIRAVKHKKE